MTAGGRYTRTLFNPSQCQDKAAADAAKNYVRILGGNLQNTAARINQRFKEVRETLQGAPRPTVPFPGVWFLGFRFAPILTFNVDAGPSGDYAVYGGMEGELGGQVVLVLDALSYFDALVNLKDYRHLAYGFYTGIETLETVAEMFATIGSADTAANKARKCRPPNPNGDPDDRRDAYQTDVLLEPTGASGGVVHYQQQLATAQRLGLTRAETYWTFKLRQAELAMFSLDPIEKSNDILEREALYYETRLTIQGLISGAIPLEPGQTITDTVRAAYDDFVVGAASTTTLQRHQTLQDALDFAQRQYSALHGQELALQQELRTQLAQAGIGVMDSGLSFWTLTALGTLGIEGQLVEILPGSGSRLYSSRYLSPFAAPSVLVVPSGGLFRYGDSQQARAWLDTYVNLGGTLIVLAQANSEDWNLLPGGEVEGLGYEQDILCKTASVRIVNSSSWIKGIGRDLPDIQIDGSFTAWPADATIVLLRTTGNQLPAMIEYDYGAGHVVAMSAYPDFYINGMQSVEDIVFARSLFGLAYLRATGQTVAGVAAAPGAAVTLPVPVHNNMSVAARELTLNARLLQRLHRPKLALVCSSPPPAAGTTVASLNPNLASGAGSTIPVTFAAPPQAGIFRTGLFLAGPYQAGATYSNWSRSGSILGPFYEVQSTYTAPPGLSVRSNEDRYAFGEPAEITVVVHNNQPLARTFELRPLAGLEAPPVVLPVGPNGNAQHVFTTRVYGRSTLRIGLAENDVLLSEAPLVLRLSPPFLGLETAAERLPAGLATNMVVTATLVDGRASQVDWEARSSTGALVELGHHAADAFERLQRHHGQPEPAHGGRGRPSDHQRQAGRRHRRHDSDSARATALLAGRRVAKRTASHCQRQRRECAYPRRRQRLHWRRPDASAVAAQRRLGRGGRRPVAGHRPGRRQPGNQPGPAAAGFAGRQPELQRGDRRHGPGRGRRPDQRQPRSTASCHRPGHSAAVCATRRAPALGPTRLFPAGPRAHLAGRALHRHFDRRGGAALEREHRGDAGRWDRVAVARDEHAVRTARRPLPGDRSIAELAQLAGQRSSVHSRAPVALQRARRARRRPASGLDRQQQRRGRHDAGWQPGLAG